MLKVLAACGNGMGSSQMIKMKIDKVFKKLNIDVKIDHMSIGEAKTAASTYDFVFCSSALASNFNVKNDKTKIIGLVNLLSEAEIEQKLLDAMNKK